MVTVGLLVPLKAKPGKQAEVEGFLVAAALMAKASELFAEPPDIKAADVIAVKLPG